MQMISREEERHRILGNRKDVYRFERGGLLHVLSWRPMLARLSKRPFTSWFYNRGQFPPGSLRVKVGF
jgi:hypothetical protein